MTSRTGCPARDTLGGHGATTYQPLPVSRTAESGGGCWLGSGMKGPVPSVLVVSALRGVQSRPSFAKLDDGARRETHVRPRDLAERALGSNLHPLTRIFDVPCPLGVDIGRFCIPQRAAFRHVGRAGRQAGRTCVCARALMVRATTRVHWPLDRRTFESAGSLAELAWLVMGSASASGGGPDGRFRGGSSPALGSASAQRQASPARGPCRQSRGPVG